MSTMSPTTPQRTRLGGRVLIAAGAALGLFGVAQPAQALPAPGSATLPGHPESCPSPWWNDDDWIATPSWAPAESAPWSDVHVCSGRFSQWTYLKNTGDIAWSVLTSGSITHLYSPDEPALFYPLRATSATLASVLGPHEAMLVSAPAADIDWAVDLPATAAAEVLTQAHDRYGVKGWTLSTLQGYADTTQPRSPNRFLATCAKGLIDAATTKWESDEDARTVLKNTANVLGIGQGTLECAGAVQRYREAPLPSEFPGHVPPATKRFGVEIIAERLSWLKAGIEQADLAVRAARLFPR
ncbi:MAG: hypothetical protein V9G19_19055 [Tetrasphaera sp.]